MESIWGIDYAKVYDQKWLDEQLARIRRDHRVSQDRGRKATDIDVLLTQIGRELPAD